MVKINVNLPLRQAMSEAPQSFKNAQHMLKLIADELRDGSEISPDVTHFLSDVFDQVSDPSIKNKEEALKLLGKLLHIKPRVNTGRKPREIDVYFYKYENPDESNVKIAQHFGVSEKTIRNRLKGYDNFLLLQESNNRLHLLPSGEDFFAFLKTLDSCSRDEKLSLAAERFDVAEELLDYFFDIPPDAAPEPGPKLTTLWRKTDQSHLG